MTTTIFNLTCKLVADKDRGRKEDKKQIEQLVEKALTKTGVT